MLSTLQVGTQRETVLAVSTCMPTSDALQPQKSISYLDVVQCDNVFVLVGTEERDLLLEVG